MVCLHTAGHLLNAEVEKVYQHMNPAACSLDAVLLLLSCPTAPSVGERPEQQPSPDF